MGGDGLGRGPRMAGRVRLGVAVGLVCVLMVSGAQRISAAQAPEDNPLHMASRTELDVIKTFHACGEQACQADNADRETHWLH